jgi:hypothetical protein
VPLKAVALKEEGTHPPAEGVLRRFANVRTIRSSSDVQKVKDERPDIVLMDLSMPDSCIMCTTYRHAFLDHRLYLPV